MTTHAVLIVDHSGSMYNLRDDVIGGVNSYLDGLEGDVRVSCMLFNTDFHIAFRDRPPKRAKRLSQKIYNPHGGTALYDAVGQTLEELEFPEGDRVIVVIQTDGQENSSQEFDAEEVSQLVKEREAEGWDFLYLGAGEDAWRDSRKIGISRGQTITAPMSTGQDIAALYRGVTGATNTYTASVASGVVDPAASAVSGYVNATGTLSSIWSWKK